MKIDFRTNNFDLIRLFASTQVLIQHSLFHFGYKFPAWFIAIQKFPGVPIFFVISGYLISSSFERNNNLKDYFFNRGLRIFPALWVCILLTILAVTIVSDIKFLNLQGFIWFVSQAAGAIYTPSFLSGFGFGSYNGSLWTIPLELQFYFLVPVLYYGYQKLNYSKYYFLIVLISFLFIAYFYSLIKQENASAIETASAKIFRYLFIPHFYLFLCGVVLNRIGSYKSRFINGKGIYWLTIYILTVNIIPDSLPSLVLSNMLLAVCIISLAYTLPQLSHKLLRGKDISYGIYIFHGLLINIILELKIQYYPVLLVAFITFPLALLSWHFVESPILKNKTHIRRFFQRKYSMDLKNTVHQ